MIDLFLNLMVAHIVGDFLCQTEESCRKKLNKKLCCKEMYLHVGIIVVLSWAVVWQIAFWWAAALIAVTHLLIDILKVSFEKRIIVADGEGQKKCLGKSRFDIWPFVVDQLLHIAVICGISYWWLQSNNWVQFAFIDEVWVYFLLVLMICCKPANILIKYILGFCKVKDLHEDKDHNSFKSGALIGTLERWLIIFFMCLQQYEAIGFLVAAKSILRFSEVRQSEKSEYVLAGTLLSLTIALVCGWTMIKLFGSSVFIES